MSCVFIIGMPACGKTYWGEKLSASFGWDFVDLDDHIEKVEGKSVVDIFREGGEGYFRTIETGVLSDIIKRSSANERLIVACGGGTAAFNDNIDLMKRSGCVIYLLGSVDVLAARMRKQIGQRPLVVDIDNIEAYITNTLIKRKKYYEQAHYMIPEQNISLSTFEEIITSCLEKR